MKVDTHMHTTFSTDSKMKMKDVISKLDSKTKFIITDHYDLKYPVKDKFIFDINEYFEKYNEYRNKYNVLLGIELGLRTDCYQENEVISKKYNFDYVLGSVHLVNGYDIYRKEFYENKTKEEAYNEYFEYILECVKCNYFIDGLGHIDYISRYSPYENQEIEYKKHKEILDQILNVLIENNIVLEINTRLIQKEIYYKSICEILYNYKKFGGEKVIVGSDAHNHEDIFSGFLIADKLIDKFNLDKVYFEKRKMKIIQSKEEKVK